MNQNRMGKVKNTIKGLLYGKNVDTLQHWALIIYDLIKCVEIVWTLSDIISH